MPPARPSYASRRLRRTLAGWVADVTGLSASASGDVPRVVWADQNLPRPTLPYVSLRFRQSDSLNTQTYIRTEIPTLYTVQVTTTTVGEAARVILNHGAIGYPVEVGDTITDVRDGLIALITASPNATDVNTTAGDTFTVAGLAPAVVYPVSAVEGCTVTPSGLSDVEFIETQRTSLIRVDTFGFKVENERAMDYGDAMIADLGRVATVQYWRENGVGIEGARSTLVDVSGLSGAERETRVYFDLQVAQWTRHGTLSPDSVTSVTSPTVGPGTGDVELVRRLAS